MASPILKWGWKTITGGLLTAVGVAGSPAGIAIFGQKASGILQGVGILLGATGIAHKFAKLQNGNSQ